MQLWAWTFLLGLLKTSFCVGTSAGNAKNVTNVAAFNRVNTVFETVVVYQLHGRTGRSTGWANDTQNLGLVNFVPESSLPFVQISSKLYQNTTGKAWGPFLESPGNFSGPKLNIQIEIYRIRARVLASKLLCFVSLTDSFITLDAKLFKPLSCMKTTTALQARQLSGLSRNGPLNRVSKMGLKKWNTNFSSEYSVRKNRTTFSDFLLLPEISDGTTQKVVFHLLSNRIFRNILVNGKQPVSHHDQFLVSQCLIGGGGRENVRIIIHLINWFV